MRTYRKASDRPMETHTMDLPDLGFMNDLTTSLLPWLAGVLADAREDAQKRQVHVAAAADMDQSAITRFEHGQSWPRNPDRLVQAYADCVGVDAHVLWRRAIDRWDEAGG